MVHYEIYFTLNGERLHTTGESSYPTKENYESGAYSEEIALQNAFFFISGYMDMKKLEGRVNPRTVVFNISD